LTRSKNEIQVHTFIETKAINNAHKNFYVWVRVELPHLQACSEPDGAVLRNPQVLPCVSCHLCQLLRGFPLRTAYHVDRNLMAFDGNRHTDISSSNSRGGDSSVCVFDKTDTLTASNAMPWQRNRDGQTSGKNRHMRQHIHKHAQTQIINIHNEGRRLQHGHANTQRNKETKKHTNKGTKEQTITALTECE